MRGEHNGYNGFLDLNQGSSPHARGTLSMKKPHVRISGIIPACAGNTDAVNLCVRRIRDHPRMRGEHVPFHHRSRLKLGSSPHARGTLPFVEGVPSQAGIIPACAGNT